MSCIANNGDYVLLKSNEGIFIVNVLGKMSNNIMIYKCIPVQWRSMPATELLGKTLTCTEKDVIKVFKANKSPLLRILFE